jgi:cytochrome c oxidase cbb3-type subunit 3
MSRVSCAVLIATLTMAGAVQADASGGDAMAITHYPPALVPAAPTGFDSATSVAEGKRLFAAMNCAGCHGYDGSGGMGPDLTDRYWRYGGRPGDLYHTIFEGRPKGMPGFGQAVTAQDIWKLAAYVRSLQGSPGGATTPSAAQPDPGYDTGGPPATHPLPARAPPAPATSQ